MMARSS